MNAQSPYLRVELTAPDNAALNVGQLISQSGKVGIYGTTIRNAGAISANGATVNEQGRIVLKATKDITLAATSMITANGPKGGSVTVQAEGGTLMADGAIETKGTSGKGGVVQLLGDKVGLVGSARVDASGDMGGGTVLVGGDYQGKNPDVQNAQRTYVGAGASIKADAGTDGDGGKVIVWSEDQTRYFGSISAKGGAQGGNGGFAEVSGKSGLLFRGAVDLSAARGNRGNLLLDPLNIEVVTGGSQANLVGGAGNDSNANIFAFAEDPAVSVTGVSGIDPGVIVSLMNTSTVTLQAHNDITVTNAIDATANTGNGFGLTLQAGHDVLVNAGITTRGGTIDIRANDSGGTGAGTGGTAKIAASLITTAGSQTGGQVLVTNNGSANPIELGAGVTTGNANVVFSDAVKLTNSVAIDTGATGGDITFSNTLNGNNTLGLTAGTGNVVFTGVVGGTTPLGAVTINNAAATNFNNEVNITGALTQTNAATGTTTFANTVAVGSADLKGVAFDVNNSFASAGTTSFTNSGTLTKSSTGAITSTGAFSTTGDVNLAANITTTNTNLTIGGNLVIAEGRAPTLSTGAGAGSITITGTTNGTVGGVAESLTVLAGTGNVTFTGAVGNNTNATELEALTITSGATTLFSGAVDLANALTQSAGSVAATFSGAVNVGSASLTGTAFNLNNSFASAGTTSFTNSGTLTKSSTGAITSTGAFSTTGNVNLASNITTTNTNLTIGGNLVVAEGRGPTLSTQGAAGAGNILVSGNTDGTAGTGLESLTLNAGTGSVTFTGSLGTGATNSLGAVTITNAAATNFNNTVNITGALTQTNAATGTTTFGNTVAVGSADLKGVAFDVNNSFASGGATSFTNSGTLTKSSTGNITSTGAFSTTGNVNLASNITTTSTDLTIGGNLVIAEGRAPTLSTGAGLGNITITGTTNGTAAGVAESLTVLAGTGNVTFTGVVGNNTNATELEALTITSGATALFSGTVDLANALTQSAGSVATTFSGAVNVGSAGLTGTAFNLNNSFASAGTTSFTNSGTLTKNATGNITSAGAFSTTGNVNLASNITTTSTDLTIGGNLVIAEGATPTLSTGAGTAGNILVSGNTDGTAGTGLESLSLQAGTGSVTFTGSVGTGATNSLGAVTITNAAATNFNNTVNITGALTQTNAATGTTTFANTVAVGSADLKGTAFNVNGNVSSTGTQVWDGPITINAARQISSTGTGAGADITFKNTIDGTGSLTVNAAGTTTFTGTVGAGGSFASLITNGGGTTAINGGSVRTTGAQSYENAGTNATSVTLGANTTLTGTSVAAGPIVGGSKNLTIATSGVDSIESGTGINALTLNKTGGSISFLGNLSSSSLAANAGAYGVGFNTGNASPYTNTTTTIPTVSFSNTGSITIGNQAGDAAIFSGGLNTTSASGTSIGGTIQTNGTAMNLGSLTVTAGSAIRTTGAGSANPAGAPITLASLTGVGTPAITIDAGTSGALQAGATSGALTLDVPGSGTVNFGNLSASSAITINSSGAINFNGTVNAGTSLVVSTLDGTINTSGLVNAAAGNLSLTANKTASAAQINVGAGGVQATGNITLRSADTLTIGAGSGVKASTGVVSLVAGSTSGMVSELPGFVSGLAPASGGGAASQVLINGPVWSSGNAGYTVNVLSSGSIQQDNTNPNAGIQTPNNTASNGGLRAITYNNTSGGGVGQWINLQNNVATGNDNCTNGVGSGNCVGPLLLETRLATGGTSSYAPGNITYSSINGTTIFGVGTAADIVFKGPSHNITTGNIKGTNVYFYGYGSSATAQNNDGSINLGIQMANADINQGNAGGSLNLIADGPITLNGNSVTENTLIGSRATNATTGDVTVTKFNHGLKLVSSSSIDITGSVYLNGALDLRAGASAAEVASLSHQSNPAAAGGAYANLADVTVRVPAGRQFPTELIASSVNVGAANAPVHDFSLDASLATSSQSGGRYVKSTDVVMGASGDINVYYSGAMAMKAGTATAQGSNSGDFPIASASSKLVGDTIKIVGSGGAGNSLDVLAGSATALESGGGFAIAVADVLMFAQTSKNIDIKGSMQMKGGTSSTTGLASAKALVDPIDLMITVGNTLTLQAGTGPGSAAQIFNDGNIVITAPGGLDLIGGSGSGLFGYQNVPIGVGDEIKLIGGGYRLTFVPGLAKATINASSPRSFDKYLSYILYAANEETRAARLRAGRGVADDSDLPSCD
ncbi:MAG: hypothetical protein WCH91_12050 [bacterium]